MKLSSIAAVPLAYPRLRLILNLLAQTVSYMSSVNKTTNREVASELLKYGRVFPRILQAVWEADLVQGPVQVSKLDVTDAYHCSTAQIAQVGVFVYVTPYAPEDEGRIICIDLVLPMG